jgi:hypothetical protein
MGTKTRNVRYPDWMMKAVESFKSKNGFQTVSDALLWLIETQLNRYGYFRENFTSKMTDLPLTEENPDPNAQKNELDTIKKQRIQIDQLKRQLKAAKSGKTNEERQEEESPAKKFINTAEK